MDLQCQIKAVTINQSIYNSQSIYYCSTILLYYCSVPLMPIPAASAGHHGGIARTATASSPLCYCLILLPLPLQVTTGSDV